MILGLDLREYNADGAFVEWAWSAYRPSAIPDADQARHEALAALARPDRQGNAVLVTWQRAT